MSMAFLQATSDSANATIYTFATQNIGVAAGDRYIVAAIIGRKSGASTTISTVTIGGVSAAITQVTNAPANTNVAALAIAAVPTGTTASVVVTFGAAMVRAGLALYRLDNLASATPFHTQTSTAAPLAGTLNIPYGCAIGVGTTATTGSCTWGGLGEDYDSVVEVANCFTGASTALVTTGPAQSITATFTSTLESAGVFASWAFTRTGKSGDFFGLM